MGLLTATLIWINWRIYVCAIALDHALDAALGYYINLLRSILLGALLLGERMCKRQLLVVGLAVGAVLVLALDAGSIPWVALGLTLSWGFCGLAKKSLPIGACPGSRLYRIPCDDRSGELPHRAPVDTWLLLGCGADDRLPDDLGSADPLLVINASTHATEPSSQESSRSRLDAGAIWNRMSA